MSWMHNTQGSADSQLTIQVAWNIIAAVVVVLVSVLSILQDQPIPDSLWLFMLGAMGIGGATYVRRRGQEVKARPETPRVDEDLAG